MAVTRISRLVLGILMGGLPAVAHAQVPVGGEFQVNTFTTDDQSVSSVAMDATGRFVVVWTDTYPFIPDPGFPFFTLISRGVFGRGFDASGQAYGDQFEIAAGTTLGANSPSVAADTSGSFVVAWGQQEDRSPHARRFDAEGTATGASVRVNDSSRAELPHVAAGPTDRFVVVWQAAASTARVVRGRLYDADDQPVTGELEVGAATSGPSAAPAVAPAPGAVDQPRILARLFDAGGAPEGPSFVVSSYRAWRSAVVHRPDGGFLVAWVQSHYDERPGVWARLFDGAGQPAGPEFQVNASSGMRFYSVALARDTDSSFVVAWDEGPDPHLDVFVRRFDTGGTAASAPLRVNSYTKKSWSRGPVVASDGEGHFVVAWTGYFAPGFTGYDVIAQRFEPDHIFADGFE